MERSKRDEKNLDSKIYEVLIGGSEPMFWVHEEIKQCVDNDDNILILGETGTGKEIVANLIHKLSKRGKKDLVVAHLPTIAESVMESELFGHTKGSFTGASSDRPGLFEVADQSTIFLDEIGDMPLSLQPKLLRVVEQKEFRRVGGRKPTRSDFRVISATHQQRGKLHDDLYYRLAQRTIDLPSLAQRTEDILSLTKHFLSKRGIDFSRLKMSWMSLYDLLNHSWPGNVRELENMCRVFELEPYGSNFVLQFPIYNNWHYHDSFDYDSHNLPRPYGYSAWQHAWWFDYVRLVDFEKTLPWAGSGSDPEGYGCYPSVKDALIGFARRIVSKPRYEKVRQEYKKRKQQKAQNTADGLIEDRENIPSAKQISPQDVPTKSPVDRAVELLVRNGVKLPEARERIIKKFLDVYSVTNETGEKLNSRAKQLGIDPKTLKKYLLA